MTIPLSGAPGALFNRLGKLGLVLKQLGSYQAAQKTNLIDTTNGVIAQLTSEPDIQADIGSSYISILNSSGSGIGNPLQRTAEDIVNRMTFRDNPQINQTMTSSNTTASIKEVIRQMQVAGASVLAMTVTATPTGFTGKGNGVIVASVRRASDGLVLENSFAENLTVTCTRDSYTGGTVAGQEGFQITGAGSDSSEFAFDWPLGSNARSNANAINGNANNSGGNHLTNSGFEKFTVTDKPDNFIVDVGSPTVNFAKETGNVFDGSAALKLIGDGATLIQFRQQFNISTGTSFKLVPLTQSAFNIWMRRGGSPVTGVLAAELVDSNGNIIQDQNGVNNALSWNFANLTTAYAAFNGIFRTPEALPATVFLRLRLSVALNNGGLVYWDKMAMGDTTQVYTSGPSIAEFSGSIPFAVGDYGTVTIANGRGAGGTLNTFQCLMDRLLDMRGKDLLLPSAVVPTISDSALIA